MHFNPDRHHRRSIRLQEYDYTQAGAYFVTICTARRDHLFGGIQAGVMTLSPVGCVVRDAWLETELHRPYIELDAWVIMPNHFHAIFLITENSLSGAECLLPTSQEKRSFSKVPARSLHTIVSGFKAAATRNANRIFNTEGTFWQRDCWEHIVRNQQDLDRIRHYIETNPLHWEKDSLYTPLHP